MLWSKNQTKKLQSYSMGRKSDPNRYEDLRNSVVEAAFTAFGEHGVEFTLKQVADLLNRSPSSFYSVFDNKESIMLAMTEQMSTELVTELKNKMTEFLALDVPESIKLMLTTLREFFLKNNAIYLRFIRSQSRRTLESKMREAEHALTIIFMGQAARHPELLKLDNLMTHIYVMFNTSLLSFIGILSKKSERTIDFNDLIDVIGQFVENHYTALIAQNK